MKDTNKLKNYRLKYKRYYGIDFGSDYVIHHIDFDRNNNDISNLLLLPTELHQRYHFYLTALCGPSWKTGELLLNTKLSRFGLIPYSSDEMLLGLIETIKECQKWLLYKEHLDMHKQFGRGVNCGSNTNK